MLNWTLSAIELVDQAPALQTLIIDFLATNDDRGDWTRWRKTEWELDSMRWFFRRHVHRPSSCAGQLKHIEFTGLEYDHHYIIATQDLSTLLHDRGTMVVGIGPFLSGVGERYLETRRFEPIRAVEDPKLRIFSKTELKDWIILMWSTIDRLAPSHPS